MPSSRLDVDTALAFLAAHPHVPWESGQDTINQIDEVRKYFIEHPDARCVPLFLELFADHDGWGIFQVCDAVFGKYPEGEVIPHLKRALRSERKATRYWAAHWALAFPSKELVPELVDLLESQQDEDAHYYAISALGDLLQQGQDPAVRKVLEARLGAENDPEPLELLRECLR